jgi:Tfp pilus assembly protein PilV
MKSNRRQPNRRGFTLIIVMSMMVLLFLIAVALLNVSASMVRSSTLAQANAEARANARLALFIAMGELQEEMGPDMRISAKASLQDTNHDTPEIDGVAQPQWLSTYDSWGTWLNASYVRPGGDESIIIQDTYGSQRSKMFRRWLVSTPTSMIHDIQSAAKSSSMDENNSAIMVGKGSLGSSSDRSTSSITRAYLLPIGKKGRHAWWIGAENQKAIIHKASVVRDLSADAWQVAQGNTAEVGVGAIQGLENINDEPKMGDKLISLNSLQSADVTAGVAKSKFYDLTSHGHGLITNVRTGQLKKDLSLVFETDNAAKLPQRFRFTPGRDEREPSIRPMSQDIARQSGGPSVPSRHFASWTNMRHYYRMYRSVSDASPMDTGGKGSLQWDGVKPWTNFVSTSSIEAANPSARIGSNSYWRFPVLAKLTIIYSLLAEPNARNPETIDCFLVYSPIFTFWNPYNVELRIPNDMYRTLVAGYKILPFQGIRYRGTQENGTVSGHLHDSNVNAEPGLRNTSGPDVVFKPGEFVSFSFGGTFRNLRSDASNYLVRGFDPQAIHGSKKLIDTISLAEATDPNAAPGIALTFCHSGSGGNVDWGNTPGSLCHSPSWKGSPGRIPLMYQNDWFQRSQTLTRMTPEREIERYVFDSRPKPIAFAQLVMKGLSRFDYQSIDWSQDWRSRNWIHSPPFYFGNSLYISETLDIAHTQRLDNPYVMYFGPISMNDMGRVVPQDGNHAVLGSGSNPAEMITSASVLELPTAPISSLAGFANMRINPGWTKLDTLNPHLKLDAFKGSSATTGEASLYCAEAKAIAYQSGITGPGIGNSFMHPMIPRRGVYQFFDNSISQDPPDRNNWTVTNSTNNKIFNDYWDHVFVLNDALWDDYFLSSLADQTRPAASRAVNLSENLTRLINGEPLANSRYRFDSGGRKSNEILAELESADGYAKVAKHLTIDGMFNVNSTSVDAWFALFAGIRERSLVYRDGEGSLRTVQVPKGKRIAISRFDTEVSDQEMTNPQTGVVMPDGTKGWSGVRFLDDQQLRTLAQECVKQVKQRGPFLNFAEFINRRLSEDRLGLMGALQSAIDFDDASPNPASINYLYKQSPGYMIQSSALGNHSFKTAEAAEGSRLAGIPGYVIQSDLLRPIANTLSVRDDTFRIRAYGESLDANGKVKARAWCEAIMQRMPDYCDPTNDADVPAREMSEDGTFSELENSKLSRTNLRFGRRFVIKSYRWLNPSDV